MTRVGVFGALGRMGLTVCDAVAGDPDLELVCGVDREAGTAAGVDVVASRDEVDPSAVDVMVDFTHIDVARDDARWCAANGIHAVLGTSGFTAADHDELRSLFTSSNCVIAPNFAIGAVLMIRFAELAAPWFDAAEIIEIHHETKVDAPSGTAVETARRMAAASKDWVADPTTTDTLPHARGSAGAGGIPIHSVRMRGAVANQEVVLGTTGQTLTIRHDTTDRSSFMPGVLLAAKRIADHPGLTIGLDALLGL